MMQKGVALGPEAVLEAWRSGVAYLALLDDGQRQAVEGVQEAAGDSFWLWGRQSGKTFAALSLSCSMAAQGKDVRYVALTSLALRQMIVVPTMEDILALCPEGARPVLEENKGRILFPWSGGSISWAGTDSNQYRRLRGGKTNLMIFDECGFYADLEAVERALRPQLITTGGHILYCTTPPDSVAHPSVQRYRAARANGRGSTRSIFENPRLTREDIDALIRANAESLGMHPDEYLLGTQWRREYLGEILTETSRQVVPEWTEALEAEVVLDLPRPVYFDAYVALDAGFRPDPSAAIFARFEPESKLLVVEEELEVHGGTLAQWVERCKEVEARLWGVSRWDGTLLAAAEADIKHAPEWLQRQMHASAPTQPYRRVGDYGPQMAATLTIDHGYAIYTPEKHDKQLQVDKLREAFRRMRLRISPKCVRLRQQLHETVWNEQRTSYVRNAYDHGDLVDSLVYLTHQVAWGRDVRPPAPTTGPTLPRPRTPAGWAVLGGARRRA